MFDIGQNDLAGAFNSKTYDQVIASIPVILLEFEAGIRVSEITFEIKSHLVFYIDFAVFLI